MSVVPLHRIDDLTDPAALEPILGPIHALERDAAAHLGFSGARHERLRAVLADGSTRRLILKRARPTENWIARRTRDTRGREAALLADAAFDARWESFANPYLAYAESNGELGLLMDDLGEWWPPDVREPVSIEWEDLVLAALAAMHARFRESPALETPWLANDVALTALIGPEVVSDPAILASVDDPPREFVTKGWPLALQRLPSSARRLLEVPASERAAAWELPRTLVHGDSKVGNFVVLPDRRVAAVDWELVAAAPEAVELGWYIAINASRLARPRNQVLARYRELRLQEGDMDVEAVPWWRGTRDLAIETGARTMLWSKAAAVEMGRAGAEEEWQWWAEELERIGDSAR